MKNELKNTLGIQNNLRDILAKHLAEKEAKDYNDLKHIFILLSVIGLAMCAYCAYVIIKL